MFKLNQLLEINEENSWMSGTNRLTPLKLNCSSESYKRNCLGFRNRKKKILLNVSIAWSFLIMTYRLDDVKILIWLKFRTDVHNSHRQVNFCKILVPFRIFQPNFLPLFCNSCFSVCNRLCNEIPGVTIISEDSKKGLLAKLLWTSVVKNVDRCVH